jgi:exosome complex RNA-binding protein Csl4
MSSLKYSMRAAAGALALVTLGACTNAGSLGNVLGGVLGTPESNQLSGTVQRVDTRNQQITLQQSNGQTLVVAYDNQTQVVYQNQNYSVSSLEPGDQVTARVQSGNNGGYYTDMVQVTQPVNGSATGSSTTSNVQSLQGTVRQVNVSSGWFTLDAGSGVLITVSLPYSPSSSDLNRFQNLRSGDYVRLYGVFINNTRVELQRFY